MSDWKECIDCGDEIHIERWALGYKRCLFCGEDQAVAERASWCVIQEYTKGGYMFVTSTSAPPGSNSSTTRAPKTSLSTVKSRPRSVASPG